MSSIAAINPDCVHSALCTPNRDARWNLQFINSFFSVRSVRLHLRGRDFTIRFMLPSAIAGEWNNTLWASVCHRRQLMDRCAHVIRIQIYSIWMTVNSMRFMMAFIAFLFNFASCRVLFHFFSWIGLSWVELMFGCLFTADVMIARWIGTVLGHQWCHPSIITVRSCREFE